MDANLIALKLALQYVGQPDSIKTVDDRLRVQKAVYLVQAAGCHLGYSYNWYLKGPYSPGLTKDYYELSAQGAGGAELPPGVKLTDAVLPALDRAKALIAKPADVELPLPQWLELLASLHYLMKLTRSPLERARETIRSNKPHLQDYIDRGVRHLEAYGML